MAQLASALLLALTAAVLAVAGDLHGTTVDVVADIDLFVRRLRSPALGGNTRTEIAKTRKVVKKLWERDLLRRVRRLRFGHPDPDVRRSAEFLEDDIWPLIGAATRSDEPEDLLPFMKPMTSEQRSAVLERVEISLAELRLAVYNAPRRDVPRRHGYTGYDLPSRVARAMHPDVAAEVERRRRGRRG